MYVLYVTGEVSILLHVPKFMINIEASEGSLTFFCIILLHV